MSGSGGDGGGVRNDDARKVRIEVARVVFKIASLATSEKRLVHGPELLVFGTDNTFETPNGPTYTIDLPCGARHAEFDKPLAIDLMLHPWFSNDTTTMMPPNAGLAFELTARHCKSDRQEEVCHTYAYGVLPFARLTEMSSVAANKGMRVPPLTFTLNDRPMQFELEFAKRALTAGVRTEEYEKLSRLQQAFLRTSGGAECFERLQVTLHGVRVTLPPGVRPYTPPSLTTMMLSSAAAPASTAPTSNFHAEDFAFIGSSARSKQAAERLRHLFEQQRDATYAPYGSQAPFKDYRAMDDIWKNFFVSVYKRGCDVEEPTALALMCTWFTQPVPERLFSHLLRAQLTVHCMSVERFVHCLRGVLATHGRWVADAPKERRHDNEKSNARMREWQRNDPQFTTADKRQLSVDEHRALGFIVLALTSMANACSYTTDFGEIARVNDDMAAKWDPNKGSSAPDAATTATTAVVREVDEIVTEQFETAPLRVRAIDCEDGAAWFMRLWLALVSNLGNWSDPVVALAAQVMDLYVVCINKMHCGECHIMPTLYLRDYALGMMTLGYNKGMSANHSTAERKLWMRGIRETCLWPAYMYDGPYVGSVGHRTDAHQLLLQAGKTGSAVQWPIPHVLYAEPTRVSPSDQMPADTFSVSDDDQMARKHARHDMRMSAVDQLQNIDVDLFAGFEPYITFPQMIDTVDALQNPMELSRFYRGFIVGCTIPPVYKLVQMDLRDSLGRSDGALIMRRTEQALSRARYFADVAYNHRAKPRTFGVYHAQLAGNDPQVSTIPYAPLDLELLLWVATVHGVEPPVLPGRVPRHLENVPLDQLGQFETLAHIESHAELRQLCAQGVRFRQMLWNTHQRGDDVGAKLQPTEEEPIVDDELQHCVDLRFLPHNGCMDPDLLLRAVQCAPKHLCKALFVRRIPLGVAPAFENHAHLGDDDDSRISEMLRDLRLQNLDVTQMVHFVDNKRALVDLARQYQCLERYTPQQWNALRHYMGAAVRAAPLYLNYVCFACEPNSGVDGGGDVE